MATDSGRLRDGYESLEGGLDACAIVGGTMRCLARLWLCVTIFTGVSACRHDDPAGADRPAPAAGSAARLDGMQLSSARRVALESASDAMKRGDIERLKQLRLWVQKRAQVAIFEPDDLESLELAIGCLEQSSTSDAASERLARLASGTLKKPARELCASKQP